LKQIGIWLDKKMAYIISNNTEESQQMKVVLSKIEGFRVHGGSGSRLKGGPQDVIQDSRYLERQKHQFKEYFKDIVKYIGNADQIVIFGPAETGEKLRKELGRSYKSINSKVRGPIKADSMTKNQMKALIRDYFKKSCYG
jgi:hypothetical protein